jgi:hypothetical protein
VAAAVVTVTLIYKRFAGGRYRPFAKEYVVLNPAAVVLGVTAVTGISSVK